MKRTKKTLSDYCLNKNAFDRDDIKSFQWVLEVSYDIHDEAMNDILKAYNSNIVKGGSFEIKFRYKKDKQQSITVLNKHWKLKKGVYCLFRKKRTAESLPEELVYDSRPKQVTTTYVFQIHLK
jgi:hypothetical protein